MRILSIQSSVAYGYAGNSAATFPLRRLGHEVWPVDTVHLSNHTGYGSARGLVFPPDVVADVLRGIADRGMLGRADVVLTGYLGTAPVADVVLDTVAAVRATNPSAVYCCDPVMGDAGKGMFVGPGIPEMLRTRVVPAADIVTPNAFELAYLAGSGGAPAGAIPADVRTAGAILRAAQRVRDMGPRTVLVTSAEDGETVAPVVGGCDGPGDTGEMFGVDAEPAAGSADMPPGAPTTISMIALDDSGGYRVSTPRLPVRANGAGDVTAALFVAHLMTAGIERALARTASSVHAILEATVRRARTEPLPIGAAGAGVEIALVAAQEAIAHPACEFAIERLA